jgi:hypothetical protein
MVGALIHSAGLLPIGRFGGLRPPRKEAPKKIFLEGLRPSQPLLASCQQEH